ncbi:hypothetical protein CR513_31598, partial [Mucuna pruriens]
MKTLEADSHLFGSTPASRIDSTPAKSSTEPTSATGVILAKLETSWCIQYPQLEPAQSYKLKSELIHLLPKFHGLASEDPHKHLKEFHMICSTMRSLGIPNIKMKAFPLSLDGAAKD